MKLNLKKRIENYPDLELRNENLYYGGLEIDEVAKKHGTPLYLMSYDAFMSRANEVKNNFLDKYSNVRAVYAGKAFLNIAMCQLLKKTELGLDVVSGGELYTAKKAGFPMEKIIFHGNNKTMAELELAIECGVGRIVVDNLNELEHLTELTTKKNIMQKVLFRISPGIAGDTHDYISTGQVDSKFGMLLDENGLFKGIELAKKAKYIEFKGLHFHIGSQLQDSSGHIAGIEVTTSIIKAIYDKYQVEVEEFNIGGGFGISYGDSSVEKTLPIASFLDEIMARVEVEFARIGLKRPQIIIEPGRWLIADSGITVYKVGTIKDIPGVRRYVSVDGGMTDNKRPALYGAKYVGMKTKNPLGIRETKLLTRVVGKCCETGDVVIQDIMLPEISRGEYFVVLSTGAYGYSMSSNYNRNTRPAVVLVKDKETGVMVKRENYDDILKNDLVPDFIK